MCSFKLRMFTFYLMVLNRTFRKINEAFLIVQHKWHGAFPLNVGCFAAKRNQSIFTCQLLSYKRSGLEMRKLNTVVLFINISALITSNNIFRAKHCWVFLKWPCSPKRHCACVFWNGSTVKYSVLICSNFWHMALTGDFLIFRLCGNQQGVQCLFQVLSFTKISWTVHHMTTLRI